MILISIAVALTGCASTQKPITYNPEKSRALNLVNAAGIGSTLKDTKLPQDTVNTLMKSDAADLSFALSGFGAPLPGLSGLNTAGLNLLATVLAPEDAAARNSIFGWMPEDFAQGKDPKKAFMNELEKAFEHALADRGFEVIKHYSNDKSILVLSFINDKLKCPSPETITNNQKFCSLTLYVDDYELENPPSFIGKETYPSFHFSAGNINNTRFRFKKNKNSNFNEFEIVESASSYLPDWAFIYLAPKMIEMDNKQKNPVPIVFEKGKALYFVTTE